MGGQLEMPSWVFTVVVPRRVCAMQTADLRQPRKGPGRGRAFLQIMHRIERTPAKQARYRTEDRPSRRCGLTPGPIGEGMIAAGPAGQQKDGRLVTRPG